ncbi:hypothetical protein SAMN05660668_02714 [Pseudobutyrivibrio sp. AR14]|uniref:hypothetical protein n=1 Tax=Pseudobutyrivibrio sp. AR14 TaxID=1520804 RepID=UPI00087F48AB|nr:hypothetical protein [Pseudobutyrivibrio sp. AR14]SCY45888.1 hypothetical protein SAMN05660668_02714 [Pseudobutyrivibrio sp. AR14]
MDYFINNRELTMSVNAGKSFIIEQFNTLPTEIKDNPLSHIHEFSVTLDSHIKLWLPGRKTNINRGIIDYKFENDREPVSHADICRLIYKYITTNIINYDECLAILIEVYYEGLYYHPDDNDYKNNLRKILFWVSLQEDINYPLDYNPDGSIKRFGRLLAFCRYAEALAATRTQNVLQSIDVVCIRANNHGRQVPTLWELEDIPQYYAEAYSRQRIHNG